MGNLVHARMRDGKFVYRVWDSERDNYLSEDLTEDQLRLMLLGFEISWAVDNIYGEFSEFTRTLGRAQKKGSSEGRVNAISVFGPWEEEVSHPDQGAEYLEQRKDYAARRKEALRQTLLELLNELDK